MSVYLDAGVLLAHLNGNEAYSAQASDILEAAARGDVQAYTSYFSMVEVIKRRLILATAPVNDEKTITEFFQSTTVKYVSIDYVVGLKSQQLTWDFRFSARDSLHVASALQCQAEVLYTTDGGLVAHSGKKSTRFSLPRISVPEYIRPAELPLT